jgi:hypothetical protein
MSMPAGKSPQLLQFTVEGNFGIRQCFYLASSRRWPEFASAIHAGEALTVLLLRSINISRRFFHAGTKMRYCYAFFGLPISVAPATHEVAWRF